MPELPEVETITRQLRTHILGSRITAADFPGTSILKSPRKQMEHLLSGRTIKAVTRRAKFIALEMDQNVKLWFHLGMTGSFSFDLRDRKSPYVQAVLHLKGKPSALIFKDIRKFGKIFISTSILPNCLTVLGPEPFGMTAEEFAGLFSQRTGRIKSLLLNQRLMSGLGNIYADESLHQAGIDPRCRASRVKKQRLKILHQRICAVLNQAIEHGGSSIDDFRDANGQSGHFQSHHRVYGRQDKGCRNCRTKIRRIWISGRSAHFCPSCQT